MICRFMKRIALAAFLFVTLVLSAAEPAPTLRRNTVDEVIAAMTRNDRQQRRYSGLKLRLEQGEAE